MPTVSGVCRIVSNCAPFRRGLPTLLLLLQESVLLAQGTGTSPWVMAVDELAKTFTGHWRRDCHSSPLWLAV